MRGPTIARLARPADAVAIARIYNQGIQDRVATFETEPRVPHRVAAQLEQQASRYPTVVAERDGQIIAWAGASSYRPRECYSGVAEFSVYTDRAHRGTGAGRLVLSRLLEECGVRGIWKVLSRIFPENEASRRLCRSLGFREVGIYRRHARLDGVWRDVVIVERLLGEALTGEDAAKSR